MRNVLAAAAALSLGLAACGGGSGPPHKAPKTYRSQNFTERRIANERIQKTDDPTHISFCTFWPPTPGTRPITVPIAGKLVSSTKRPDDPLNYDSNDSSTYNNADAQGMYGTSTPYRYGYTPGDVGWEFPADNTTCTDSPSAFQADNTLMVSSTDNKLATAAAAAEAELRKGVLAGSARSAQRFTPAAQRRASQIIDAAIKAAGGK